MTKHIFVTGGVVSSLGKGITTASVGMILKRMGLHVRLQKVDPYLNVDPGTMNPFEHGEVYVTADGAETDLDLGHYERFTGDAMDRDANFTTGQVYGEVIRRERRGDFLGKTVQVVPHVTDEIKIRLRRPAKPGVDVVISEIGGTVGDIESLPFLEAIRQFRHEIGPRNVMFLHMTLVPYLRAAGEAKTKPTQQSVGELRRIGVQPDVIVVRTEHPLGEEACEKIALFCNVPTAAVIEEKDVDHSIYEVPAALVAQGLDRLISEHLGLPTPRPRLDDWVEMIERIKRPRLAVRIAVVGKYMRVRDAYKSVFEALAHAGAHHGVKVECMPLEAEELEHAAARETLEDADGVLVPGGFGVRGIEGKCEAIRFARERQVPYLGLCLGMQTAVIEFARNVCGLSEADSAEFDPTCAHPVVALLPEQRNVVAKGGTMRLGAWPCVLREGSRAHAAYGKERVMERHRHRFEFNNEYRERLAEKGLVFSGLSPDGRLVEIVELHAHPWFVAAQFHPEFQSTPTQPHPLFRDFIGAAIHLREARK